MIDITEQQLLTSSTDTKVAKSIGHLPAKEHVHLTLFDERKQIRRSAVGRKPGQEQTWKRSRVGRMGVRLRRSSDQRSLAAPGGLKCGIRISLRRTEHHSMLS